MYCKAARRIGSAPRVSYGAMDVSDARPRYRLLEVPFYRTYSCIPLYASLPRVQRASALRTMTPTDANRNPHTPIARQARTVKRALDPLARRGGALDRPSALATGASSPAGESRSSCPSVPPRPAGGPVRRAHTTTHRIAGMERPPRAIAMTPRTSLRTPRAASV